MDKLHEMVSQIIIRRTLEKHKVRLCEYYVGHSALVIEHLSIIFQDRSVRWWVVVPSLSRSAEDVGKALLLGGFFFLDSVDSAPLPINWFQVEYAIKVEFSGLLVAIRLLSCFLECPPLFP